MHIFRAQSEYTPPRIDRFWNLNTLDRFSGCAALIFALENSKFKFSDIDSSISKVNVELELDNAKVEIRKPKRVVHCSDGVYEEYSDEEGKFESYNQI